MTEYIEREAALKAIHEEWDGVCNYDGSGYALANELENVIDSVPTADVRPVVQREAVMQALNKYFSIGDSDTYELTRVKEAFYVGIMTLDDFEEWNEDNVSDLCDYLMKEIFGPNCGADTRLQEVDS